MTNDLPQHDDDGRTVTIYDTCRQFDAARTSGDDPRIEDFLQEAGGAERGILLRELLCMEIAARRQRDEEPSLDEYRSRFPDDGEAVEEAFERASAETINKGVAPTLILAPREDGAKPAAALDDTFSATGKTEMLGGSKRGPAPTEIGGVSDYDLLDKLGEGGMGVVYRARQRSADRIVAVKVIRPDRIQNLSAKARQAAIDRFRNEAHATARIDHDHIVTVYEVGEFEGRHYFSMSYVAGRNLAQLVADGALSNRQAAFYMQQVASAIQAAHLHGILHRDLKPQNVMVDEDAERAMVADFGLAKLIEDESQLTREGEVMGTPQYMSPEQAKDAASVTTLTDVYALGATLYHLLTGKPPFHGGTAIEVLRRVIDEPPVAPSTVKDDVDPDLETICLKCMEKDPQRRYASAQEVAEEFTRYLEGRPIHARPLGTAARFGRWCRRNPMVAALAGTAIVSLVVAMVASMVGYVETTAALEAEGIARKDAEQALDAEQIARIDAEANYREALSAVNQFYTEVGEDVLLDQPGMQLLRQSLLLKAREYFEKLLKRPSSDDAARADLAANFFRVGRIDQLLQSREKALESFQQARQKQEELLSESPDDVARIKALGNTLNAMGEVSLKLAQTEAAEKLYRETIRLRRRVVDASGERDDRRKLANAEMNLGILLRLLKRFDDAREQMIAAQELREALLAEDGNDLKVRYDLGKGYHNLGLVELEAGDRDQAQVHANEAIDVIDLLRKEIAPADVSSRELSTLQVRYSFVVAAELLGDASTSSDEKIKSYLRSLNGVVPLRRENPAVELYQFRLAHIALFLGAQYVDKNEVGPDDIAAAAEHFRTGLNEIESFPAHETQRSIGLLKGMTDVLKFLEEKAPNDPVVAELKKKVVDLRQKVVTQYKELMQKRAATKESGK